MVLALGGFDEALDTGAPLPGGGDLDIFYRLPARGHAIVCEPRCLVFHQHRRTYAELRHQMWTWGLGFMAFVAKSYRDRPRSSGRASAALVVALVLVPRLARALPARSGAAGGPWGSPLAQLAGGVVGLLGEYARSTRRVRRLLAAAQAAARARSGGGGVTAVAAVQRVEVVRHLVRRDFRLRYHDSSLGVAWSLLLPLTQLLVLVFLFQRVVPLGIDAYPAFVFSGLLPWSWFSTLPRRRRLALRRQPRPRPAARHASEHERR